MSKEIEFIQTVQRPIEAGDDKRLKAISKAFYHKGLLVTTVDNKRYLVDRVVGHDQNPTQVTPWQDVVDDKWIITSLHMAKPNLTVGDVREVAGGNTPY